LSYLHYTTTSLHFLFFAFSYHHLFCEHSGNDEKYIVYNGPYVEIYIFVWVYRMPMNAFFHSFCWALLEILKSSVVNVSTHVGCCL
jgi:hypothetical protein